MLPRRRSAVLPLLIVLLCTASVLAACKGAVRKGAPVTVDVTSTPTTSTPTPRTTGDATGHSNPNPGTLHAGRPMSHLPGTCGGLMPTPAIVNAIGEKIKGPTEFVQGLPDNSISRVGYINCRYGGSNSKPTIEIQVSLYTSDAKAAARIRPNTDDFTGHGAKATRTTVGGVPATVLIGAFGDGYPPTIVMALGQRTIAVSIQKGAVKADQLTHDLTALAYLAAERTTR